MKKFKKIILVILAAVLCFLSGCGQEREREKVEITLMHGWGGTLKTHKTMQEIYADFSKENPDIILNCIPYSDSIIAVEKANDMLAVGKMPDIISTNGLSYYVSNAVKRGKALDLMPYIEQDPELKSEIHPSVLADWTTSNNKIYTLPDALEVAGYWYNTEYFKLAGISRVPQTWEEFFTACDKLSIWSEKQERKISVVSLDNLQVAEFFILARIAGSGKTGWKAATHEPNSFDKKLMKKVMKDVEKLYRYSKDVENIESARQDFFDGKSAVYFNGVWESDILSESSIMNEMGYACYPMDNGKSLSYISPSSGYVVADSQDKRKMEACIRFIKYILSDSVQMKFALETSQAPSNPRIDQEDLIKQRPLLGNAIDVANQADYHIKTIYSLWNEECANVILRYVKKKDFNNDRLIVDLNKALHH